MDFMVRGGMVVDVTPDHVQRTSPRSKMRVVGPEDWIERSSGDGICEDGMMSQRREREGGECARVRDAGRWRVLSGYSAHLRKKERQGLYIARVGVSTSRYDQIADFLPTHLSMTWYGKSVPLSRS